LKIPQERISSSPPPAKNRKKKKKNDLVKMLLGAYVNAPGFFLKLIQSTESISYWDLEALL